MYRFVRLGLFERICITVDCNKFAFSCLTSHCSEYHSGSKWLISLFLVYWSPFALHVQHRLHQITQDPVHRLLASSAEIAYTLTVASRTCIKKWPPSNTTAKEKKMGLSVASETEQGLLLTKSVTRSMRERFSQMKKKVCRWCQWQATSRRLKKTQKHWCPNQMHRQDISRRIQECISVCLGAEVVLPTHAFKISSGPLIFLIKISVDVLSIW